MSWASVLNYTFSCSNGRFVQAIDVRLRCIDHMGTKGFSVFTAHHFYNLYHCLWHTTINSALVIVWVCLVDEGMVLGKRKTRPVAGRPTNQPTDPSTARPTA